VACPNGLLRDGSGVSTNDYTGACRVRTNTAGSSPEEKALLRHLSPERMSAYLQVCDHDLSTALRLYRWNTAVSGAWWEALAHLEVVLRNALDRRLAARHERKGRPGSWLDDPAHDLHQRARDDIATARRRLRIQRKPQIPEQIITELSFGFWRYLATRHYRASLWPDLASAFLHAPNRALATIERPVAALYGLRNRVAHHEKLIALPLDELYRDLLDLLGYIDPAVRAWVEQSSRVPALLDQRPR
jgi:hypothetical protein